MNKQSVLLPGAQGTWDSYISKYQPDSQKVLDNMFTANSKNFLTDQTGMIDKRQGGVTWNRTSFSGPARDSYDAIFESGAQHYLRVGQGILSASTGNGIFTTIQSGFATFGNFEFATYQDRVYGDNGINPAIVYDTITSYGGVTYPFTTGMTKPMGAQPPLTAPVSHTPTSGGSIPVGPHRYEVTFMYYGSEESNGSPASAVQTTTSGFQTILLTSVPIGGYGVTARNIYRDNNDGVFLLLDTINDNTTTTYTDTLAQGSTPTPIPTDNGTPPTFSKIALWLDSLWVAPTGNTNTLVYSNAGSPDIFAGNNFVRCQSDDIITAILVYNGTLYVWGLHSFGSIQGTTPDTFYYYNISNTIGCTDNRSIQIRSVVSIPTLWWLSSKGIYFSNGYTVEYGSDLIQDLVNLQLSQVNYTLGTNVQNSQAQYAGDTYTPGIDIMSIPGTITTLEPEADYSQTSDWLGGSVVTNLKTSDSNFAEAPTQFAPTLASGVYGGQAEPDGSGNNITLIPFSGFTGDSSTTFTNAEGPSDGSQWSVGQPFFVPSNGTLTSVTVFVGNFGSSGTDTARIMVWATTAGHPGTVLFTGTTQNVGSAGSFMSDTPNISLSTGTEYWLGYQNITQAGPGAAGAVYGNTTFTLATANSSSALWNAQGGVYKPINIGFGNPTIVTIRCSYVFSPVATPATGTWASPIYDSGVVSGAIPNTLTITATYPMNTSSSITVYTSASASMTSPNTQTFVNLNGTVSLSLTGLEFWQVVITVSTTDNRDVPLVSAPVIVFSTMAVWVSQPINATSDNTGWDTLTFTGNVSMGTSITIAIATSPDNITYSSFGPIGSALTEPWAKIQFILTTDAGDTISPSLSEITLTWSLTSTITSSPIDTGTVPSGFSTMQFVQSNAPAGAVTMYIRTATTALGLSSATYVLVPNGTFPNLTPDEFVQWKLVLMSSVNNDPQITSVTVNWFIGTGTVGVRVASLFYNKTYYLSVATIGATANDTLIQLDQFGKWRIQKDNSVGTLLLYFNTLYFSDGVNGNIYNGFIAPTDNGTPIVMDVRTKAWHEADDIFLKLPRGLKVTGLHTGTLIHAYYSMDRGNTWVEMFNEMGAFGYQTTTSGLEFVTLFVPDADTLAPGRTLMFRLVSPDMFPCSIINFEPTMYSRKGRYLSGGL